MKPRENLISDDKMDFTVGIVSRNLATMSNFVEFRDSRNCTFFEETSVVRNTWHILSGSQCATCQRSFSQLELKCGAHVDTWHDVI